MNLWDISGDGSFWKVQLDVRDVGDFTRRARAGTLFKRVGEATVWVAAVGALPLGFQVKLGLVRGKYLPAGLHAGEGFLCLLLVNQFFSGCYCSCSLVSQDTSCQCPAIHDLPNGPAGVDLVFHIVWSRFRMMRRYLAYCPLEEHGVFRTLGLISRGALAHGPVHLLLISAAELGLLGMERSEVGYGFPSLP